MPPRPLRPKDEPNTSDGAETAPEPKLSKRRAVSSACIPCRKRKSKCDGAVPSCSTCTAVYRTECSYDADSDHRRKGALKRDIQSLQQANDALDVIVASLRGLPESESISLLHSLRSDANPETIADSLRSNVRLPHSFAAQTLEADFTRQNNHPAVTSPEYDAAPLSSSLSREISIEDGYVSSNGQQSEEGTATWFRVPQDAEFIEHLLNLYFCWVHPFYHFFSRDHFLRDMGRGRTEFCSAMLVNALLAVACTYSDRPLARSEPSRSETAGENFFAEAKRLCDSIEKPSLTTIQALALMSIRESSQGRDSNGYRYAGRCVRMALELGLHLSVLGSGLRPAEVEVRKITFWGVFNLETNITIGVGRLSQLPRTAADIERPTINDRADTQAWRPYEDMNLSLSPSAEQPLRPNLFTDQLCKLSELASDMVNTFYAPHERFTSRRLAATYAQYQEWYRDLPDCFRLENTSLPHVLILHMYYHACVLHLFRPYIKLDLRGANLFPRDTCTYCANEISSLMNALRAMYGLRRVCLAVTGMLLSASTIHLLNLPSEPAVSYLSQALHDFKSMSINHQFAARCVEIVQSLASKWNISLPAGAAAVSVFRNPGRAGWPSPSQTFYAPSIPRANSSAGSGQGKRSSESMPSNREAPFPPPNQPPQASSLPYQETATTVDGHHSQPAFWTPFPLQGMPFRPEDFPGSPMDFSQMNAMHSMNSFDGQATHSSSFHQQTPTVPSSRMDENMGGTFDNWNWH